MYLRLLETVSRQLFLYWQSNIVYINDIFVDRLERRGQVLPHFSHIILTEKDANA